jgi:uncharacterized protein (TIGR02246 family)
MINGRERIADFYSNAFAHGYAGSQGASEIRQVRTIGSNVAVVEGEWSITDAHDQTTHERPPEHGIFSAVLVRHGSKWLIHALREQTSAQCIIS